MGGDFWQRFRLPIGLGVVGIVLILGGVFTSGLNKSKPKDFPKESLIDSQKTISVDVSGAVNTPGVYKLKGGSRIEDAIIAAGGFTEVVNKEYVSKYLNMAQLVSDGSKVYVPVSGDSTSPPAGGYAGQSGIAGVKTEAKVNINTATQAELEALSGIGPVTASKIISDRPYKQAEDLLNKKVVSKGVFEKIKDQVVVY